MNTQHLTSAYYDLTHGWRGLVLAYGVIAIFSLAGLKRGGARTRHYLFWPITSFATMVVIAIALTVIWMLTSHFGLTPSWPMQNILSASASPSASFPTRTSRPRREAAVG